EVLEACHTSPVGCHHGGIHTTSKVLQCGYYWSTMIIDSHMLYKCCVQCQLQGSISRRYVLPLSKILEIDFFYVWGIYFMGPFPRSFGNK
ncbi:hypothetical protein MTR67_048083, partial [Solanum verrucosum]